jgi:tRNA(fMet)-specific endonuclease VapC
VILLDTDTLTLLTMGHLKVQRRLDLAEDDIAITIVTRIEVLRGRFDFVLKAADGPQLLIAQTTLE